TRAGSQSSQDAGNEAMAMEQGQYAQQSVPRSKRQGGADVVGRQTNARVRQRYHLRPRRAARGQEDERVISAGRKLALDNAPRRQIQNAERAARPVRPCPGIDDGDAKRMRDV